MSPLTIVVLVLYFVLFRFIILMWHAFWFNARLGPSKTHGCFSPHLYPGTIILSRIKWSPFNVNHISLVLSNDYIFECMPSKKTAKYHFFVFHRRFFLPRIARIANGLAFRHPLIPLTDKEQDYVVSMAHAASSSVTFNHQYAWDLFWIRFCKVHSLVKRRQTYTSFCSHIISSMLGAIHRINVSHDWSFPSEFSSHHPNDALRDHYGPNTT